MGTLQGVKYYISKSMGKAIMDYQMIAEGDKIAVAVSGGKDSLTLLKFLKDRQKFVPVKYELLAVHVDMGYPCHHPKILGEYFKKIGVEYHIEKIDILKGKSRKDISCGVEHRKDSFPPQEGGAGEIVSRDRGVLSERSERRRGACPPSGRNLAVTLDPRSQISCFWCSWNRRKALFEVTKRFACTKLALGHHKDDIIETTLMNMFFNGEISSMNPRQELFKGAITIIRPLAYVDEDLIVKSAKELEFPHHKCTCPNSVTSKRTRITEMIKELKKDCPDIKTNIFRSIKRIRPEYLL
ncbi:MAG: ATP-binding protein [Candidatus Omnitrophica bacterium]|nr:ATP-binding protein [Candidatus Omnitrophota bacterium]